MARKRRWIAGTLALVATGALGAPGALAGDPPYDIPAAPSKPVYLIPPPPPSVPLIAVLTMPRNQTLRGVLAHGLVANLYAYRAVKLQLAVRLPARTARRIGLGKSRLIARRRVVARQPGVYRVRLVVKRRARQRMRRLRSVVLSLRNTLVTDAARSSSTSSVRLGRRQPSSTSP